MRFVAPNQQSQSTEGTWWIFFGGANRNPQKNSGMWNFVDLNVEFFVIQTVFNTVASPIPPFPNFWENPSTKFLNIFVADVENDTMGVN